jgi:voltage-gated potassium channel
MPLFLVAARLYRRIRERRILLLLLLAGAIVVVGGFAFAACDGVGVGTGLYWSVTTATTVGYGDVTVGSSPSVSC